MKDYAQYQGSVDIGSSRDAIRTAQQMGLIENGADWMSTIESRNITSHAYDEDNALNKTKDLPPFLKYLCAVVQINHFSNQRSYQV